MEINTELIKKNINILLGVYSDIISMDVNTRKSIDRVSELLEALGELRMRMWSINSYQKVDSTRASQLLMSYHKSVKLARDAFCQKRRKRTKLKSFESGVASLTGEVYFMKIKEKERCEDCGTHLVRYKNFQYCQKCCVFKGKIYLFKDEEADDDIKQTKTNIPKHFEATLNKIYGSIDEKSAPSQAAIDKLKEILDKRNFNIDHQVHYTKALMQQLKKIGEVQYPGGKYNFGGQTANTNYFLQRLYPKLEIPRLTSYQRTILENTFLEISSEFQQMYPNLYSNSYQYTIHRILHMLFPRDATVRKLLRFIYLQNITSFEDKDEKLNNVNNNIRCFRIFAYLPSDIYTNGEHYNV